MPCGGVHAPPTDVVGVGSARGNDPHTVTEVRRTNGGSRYSVPLRVIPDRGKVAENSGKSSTPQSPDVLHDCEAGSKLANEARKLSPQAGSLTVQAGTLTRERDVLAGEAAADAVDSVDSVGPKSSCIECSYIVIAGHLGPVFGQHAAAEWVHLAEGDGAKAGALQAERKAADAAEQVEQVHGRGSPNGVTASAHSTDWRRDASLNRTLPIRRTTPAASKALSQPSAVH